MSRSGRSPLTRGRRLPVAHPILGVGSIPAHAGQTLRYAFQFSFQRVDPRSRGADRRRVETVGVPYGRSPLTRGRPTAIAKATMPSRSIPAHAGQTVEQTALFVAQQVDPRSRGADRRGAGLASRVEGRSPLTRGRLRCRIERRTGQGSIPAHAGQTHMRVPAQVALQVDPRSRGADGAASRPRSPAPGRSPLTRGRPTSFPLCTSTRRSIPAHAGQTSHYCVLRGRVGVDPRSRGADLLLVRGNPLVEGRSPLTRGRLCSLTP